MRVLIIGAGGHGQVVADILLAGVRRGSDLVPCGYLDDDQNLWGQTKVGLPVLGPIEAHEQFPHDAVVIAIGDNLARRDVLDRLSNRCERFARAHHPSAIVSDSCVVRHGTVIGPGVAVNTGTCVGANVILNTCSSVDHHNTIGDHAHIAPGAHLGGDVTIGEGALIGIGAIVLPGRRVGPWTVVGAGAVVTEDLPAGVIAVGAPARVLTPRSVSRSANH
jgi:sugar O-acyltransferase (sialic acid O-acetyltransferase NeuD family)